MAVNGDKSVRIRFYAHAFQSEFPGIWRAARGDEQPRATEDFRFSTDESFDRDAGTIGEHALHGDAGDNAETFGFKMTR